jgi:hypothetical protein
VLVLAAEAVAGTRMKEKAAAARTIRARRKSS